MGGPIFQGLRAGFLEGRIPWVGIPGSQGEGFLGVGSPAGWDSGRGDWGPRLPGPGPQPQSAQAGPYPSLAPWPRCLPWRRTPACICSAPGACARSSSAARWCPPAQEPGPRLNPSPANVGPGAQDGSSLLHSVAEILQYQGPVTQKSRACLPHQLALPPGPAPPRAPPPAPHPQPRPHLLHVLLGPQVRRVHERAHDLDVAVHHQRLIRPVRVDAHTTMVEDSVRHLRPLPTARRCHSQTGRGWRPTTNWGWGWISPRGRGICSDLAKGETMQPPL